MLLQKQIADVNNEIVTKRRELDGLLDLDHRTILDRDRVDVLEQELSKLERAVDNARRWLSSCGVAV